MKFPTFEGINSTYRMEADNADIRKAIVQAVPKATEQTKEMASGFSGSSDQETCKKIFDFLKTEIKYKADGSDQIIRYPSALLKTRTGDCKSYSLLTAAILNNLKIPCRFVLQSFQRRPYSISYICRNVKWCKS
jgi:Transglutaminase-like enzymes, putative cysteine proteases